MTYVEPRTNVWEALAGRAPGVPSGPADAGLWHRVADRLDPAGARPVLRAGIEVRHRATVRGGRYVMLRSPDEGGRSSYLRLGPDEYQLALMMDGTSTVARLVAEFARIAGRLAPDQVRRVVADLAANRMLEELPTDAFRPLREIRREPLPKRVGGSLVAAARGRRVLSADVDGLITAVYRGAGRFLFTRVAFWIGAALAATGLVLFAATWQRGSRSLFLVNDSYLLGAIVLLSLNVLALAVQEFGHALGAKRVGREVPAAGLMIHFGIPSVFVDTSDVWMAGRRARMAVTAAGPAAALGVAGLAQLIGLAVPATGGVAFKLAFLFYLQTFFNLSPLLPLDGHYLLMDWLEVPDLRARALSWLSGRLRRRGPRWSALDREGRLLALYALLAVLWLAVAAGLGHRLWTDRVRGLAVGLWYEGMLSRLLLIVMVLGLVMPLLYVLLSRLTAVARRWRQRAAERDRDGDLPRRLAALHASELGGLPEPALHELAGAARWQYPPTGRLLTRAGDPQDTVFLVVEGALHGRRPGDPGGTIRHHVGPGGVVGLAGAFTGRTSQLTWYAAGATLLAMPAATVATVAGPMPGPPPEQLAEAERLFADTPALAALEDDQRLALIAGAHPTDLDPGVPVVLPGPTHAVVVESGVIAMPDGIELRRGTLVGPVGDGSPGAVAQTRTPVRLWIIPDASDLRPLVGVHGPGAPMPAVRPSTPVAVRPGTGHPPLAVPPGPPADIGGYDVDRHFERRMWAMSSVLLAVALVSAGLNLRSGPAWAEMPAERVLLTVQRGQAAVAAGTELTVRPDQRRYLAAGTAIKVPDAGRALLTFPGGATVLLCGGSSAELNGTGVAGGRQQTPSGRITLGSGRMLADTTSPSGAYRPLALTVQRGQDEVRNDGRAWFAVDPVTVTVASGDVTAGSVAGPATGVDLDCGDGAVVTPPSAGPSEEPTEEGTFPPDPTESAVPSPTLPTTVPGTIRTTPPRQDGDDVPAPTRTSARPPSAVPSSRPPSSRPTPSRTSKTPPPAPSTTATTPPVDPPDDPDPTEPTEDPPTEPTEDPPTEPTEDPPADPTDKPGTGTSGG
ncbi:cyclic nucleotide-binding protein [Actinoplanes sp. DH11]|uniref:cyclic nucleotide-binding protein n=1 Tax=Actinoplanes sp. DH11 TaxID=2857011 RepID=UPI001E63BD6B|nr:cyclic nucleotide-binding protein [Actinoplanes sp. DH11]